MSKKWIIPMVAALVLVPTGTSIYYGVQYNNLQHSEQVESNSGLVKTIEELRQSVASLTTEREKLNADLNKITAENEANKALVADLKVQVTNLTAVKTEYEVTHAEDTATIASLNSQIDTLNARIATYEATIAENEAIIESLTTQKTELTIQVDSLTERVNTLTEENSTWETNYNNLSLEYDLLSERFDALTETSHALQTEVARLNGALTAAQNTDTALVNSLLKDVFADTIIKDTFSDDSCMAGMKYLQTETLLLVYTPSTETYSILYTSTEVETNIASVTWSENKAVITLANSDILEVVVPGATTPQASVTFYNGETAVSVVSLDKGTKVSSTDIPTLADTDDAFFAGWVLNIDATELVDLSSLDVTENLVLYAKFGQKDAAFVVDGQSIASQDTIDKLSQNHGDINIVRLSYDSDIGKVYVIVECSTGVLNAGICEIETGNKYLTSDTLLQDIVDAITNGLLSMIGYGNQDASTGAYYSTYDEVILNEAGQPIGQRTVCDAVAFSLDENGNIVAMVQSQSSGVDADESIIVKDACEKAYNDLMDLLQE